MFANGTKPASLNKIFLTGFMGSGKSTIGPLLAGRLGWSFIDTDRRVEELAQRSVSEIFQEQGEVRFRELETQVLAEAVGLPNRVISLGGGALLNEKNWAAVDANHTIYLRAETATLNRRLETTKARRPLLPDGLSEGLISELLERRRTGYERARIQISTDDKTPDEVTAEILQALEEALE